jgi:aspartyl protease family protein
MQSTVKMAAGVGVAAVIAATLVAEQTKTRAGAPAPGQQRVAAAPLPAQGAAPAQQLARPRKASGGAVSLTSDGRGHYFAPIEINGRVTTMMVDTGASSVALSAEDVRKLGVVVPANAPTAQVSTANGIVSVQRVRLPEVRLDSIVVRDVEATLLPEGVRSVSLLGMTFLNKLSSFQVADGELLLKP